MRVSVRSTFGYRRDHGDGAGSLTVQSQTDVPVNLVAPVLTGTVGANQSITTSGALTLAGTGGASKATPGLGAVWTLQGSSIAQNGTIELPAGMISLIATAGDVSLGAGSVTTVAGTDVDFTAAEAAAAGGQIALNAVPWQPSLCTRAQWLMCQALRLPTARRAASRAHSRCPRHRANSSWRARLRAPHLRDWESGSFTLDVGSGLAGNGFDALETTLAAGDSMAPWTSARAPTLVCSSAPQFRQQASSFRPIAVRSK